VSPGAPIAALAGALTTAGLLLTAAAIAGITAPVPGAPPPRWKAAARRLQVTGRQAVIAAAAGVAVLAVTRWPVAAIATAPAVIAIPRILSRRPAHAKIAKLEALESWTRRLASVLAASRGLEDAMIHSAGAAAPPIKPAVTALATALQRRVGTVPALLAFAEAIGDPVGDLIATALVMAAERRGPGVHAVLAELANDVGKDVASRREVEAERAAYRTALAWIVAFLLGYSAFLIARRSYSAPYSTPAGQTVLAAVACCYAGGLWWLHRLAAGPAPARFLPDRSPAGEPGAQPGSDTRQP